MLHQHDFAAVIANQNQTELSLTPVCSDLLSCYHQLNPKLQTILALPTEIYQQANYQLGFRFKNYFF